MSCILLTFHAGHLSIKRLVAQGLLASSRRLVSCIVVVQREKWRMKNIGEKRDSIFALQFFRAAQRLTEDLEEAKVLSSVQSPKERTASFVSNLLFIVLVKTTSTITSSR